MRKTFLLLFFALIIISGCAPQQENSLSTPSASAPAPSEYQTESVKPLKTPKEGVKIPPSPTKIQNETSGRLTLYPGTVRTDIPDKILKGFSDNQIPVFEGYLVAATPDSVMSWYQDNMPGWELQNEAKPYTSSSAQAVRAFKKDSQGLLVFAQSNFSEGETLLVIASGSWTNIECCSRQIFDEQEGDGRKDGPVSTPAAATPLTPDAADDIVIMASPVNLDQVEAISKFRSGAGHWYSTSNYLGEPEPPSNMKHYVKPLDSERNKTEVYAPFDGEIVNMGHVERGPGIDGGTQFFIEQRPYNGWIFGFCHVNIKEGLSTGSQVKAGELLGYAMVEGAHDFDLSLQGFKESGVYHYATQEILTSNLDSIFNHMAPEVYQEFVGHGFAKENMIISKEFRESHPLKGEGEPNTTFFNFIPDPANPLEENFVIANKTQDLSINISLPFSLEDTPFQMMPMGETINHPGIGHPGIDFMWDKSIDIVACADGTVIFTEKSAGHDKWDVYLQTGNFIIGYTTLETVDEKIKVGSNVAAGQKIGEPGYFGHYMIHWEIERDLRGVRFCPMAYFDEASRQRILDIWEKTSWPEMKGSFPYICNGNFRCDFCRTNGY